MHLNVMFICALPLMFKIQHGNKGMLLFSVTVFYILFITETGMNMFAPCINSIKNTFIVPTDAHYYKISWKC